MKLPSYELAPITPEAFEDLEVYFTAAPEWATHIGQDRYGVHYFDHHPMVHSDTAFLKGLLPNTHKVKMDYNTDRGSESLKVVVLPRERAIAMEDMKVGQVVRFMSHGDHHHKHWNYELNATYNVVEDLYGDIGPLAPTKPTPCIPSRNWANWEWTLVSDVPTVEPVVEAEPEATVESLKAELAATKAKLWEAEWKLSRITQVAQEGIL